MNSNKCTFYSSCDEYLAEEPAFVEMKVEGGEILKLPVCHKCEKLLQHIENKVNSINGNTEI